jgi:ubiquinone biosynthesis protein UbiJ
MLTRPSAAAINHLLQQNRWAAERLLRFAGKTVRFDIAPFSIGYTILPDGLLTGAAPDASADAVCKLSPSLLPRLAMHDEKAHAEVQTEGDAALLTEIFFLSRNLGWDMAEDLSPLTGDILAERLVRGLRLAGAEIRNTAGNLTQAAAEYWTEERPLLAKPGELAHFIADVDSLRDDLARLQQRVRQLSGQ